MGFIVAVDGTAGSGKGSVTKVIAERLGLIAIDTGAMYRCVALECINQNITCDEIEKIKEVLKNIDIEIKRENSNQLIFLNGKDVTREIRTTEVDKVVEATKLAKEANPELAIDGEFQFDAAYVESVAAKKAPESDVAGHANVFVFPEIQSGNIGYKIAQRLGGYQAIGPILQGMNQPISDLSRGCNEEDVYKISIITAAQSLMD